MYEKFMNKFFAFNWFVLLFSCSSKQGARAEKLEIVIEDAQSYKYDLSKQTYTVFGRYSDTTVNFRLTNLEKKEIADKYYALRLDEIQGKQMIEDNCEMMPKLFSVLKINSKYQSQEITIDDGCGNYKGLFDTKGKRVVAFLQFVADIIRSKPEIMNAPKSDRVYL